MSTIVGNLVRGVGVAAAFLLVATATHAIDASGISEFIVAVTVALVVSAFGEYGLSTLIVRQLARSPRESEWLRALTGYWKVAVIAAVASGLLTAVVYGIVFEVREAAGWAVAAGAGMLGGARVLESIVAGIFRAKLRVYAAMAINGTMSNLMAAVTFTIYAVTDSVLDPAMAVFVVAGAAMLTVVVAVLALSESRASLKATFGSSRRGHDLAGPDLHGGVAIAMTSGLIKVERNLEILLGGLLLAGPAASSFVVACRSAAAIGVPLTVVNSVDVPRFLSRHSHGDRGAERELRIATVRASCLTIIAYAALVGPAWPLLNAAMASTIADYRTAFAILGAAYVINVVSGPTATLLMMFDGHRHAMITTTSTVVLASIVAVGGFYVVGANGLAAGAVVAFAVRNVIQIIELHRRHDLDVSCLSVFLRRAGDRTDSALRADGEARPTLVKERRAEPDGGAR